MQSETGAVLGFFGSPENILDDSACLKSTYESSSVGYKISKSYAY